MATAKTNPPAALCPAMTANPGTLCHTFRDIANCTWGYLDDGRQAVHQPGEETITDINVIKLRLAHAHEVLIKTFTKPQEGVEGADWEWWFIGQARRGLGCRVQAKILDLTTEELEHLHYQKKSQWQCDKLLRRAVSQEPTTIAVVLPLPELAQA